MFNCERTSLPIWIRISNLKTYHLSYNRDEICSLTIRRVQAEHNGPWLCIAEDDDGDEDQQYVFLDVKNAGSKLEVGLSLNRVHIFRLHKFGLIAQPPKN